jgi:hypothetical protein
VLTGTIDAFDLAVDLQATAKLRADMRAAGDARAEAAE